MPDSVLSSSKPLTRMLPLSVLAAMLILAIIAPASAMETRVCIENATISDLRDALIAGNTTAVALVNAYLARIETYDRSGPHLNAVREVNPDALAVAAENGADKPATQRPLEGVPILLKDNIATGGAQ